MEPSNATALKSGSVLAGKYRLVSIVGSGGMGAVWRAEHLGLSAPVAVKLLATELDRRQDAIARFLREAQSAANLRSPHVVQVFDHGVDEASQTPFIVMELMKGESLAERLARVGRLSAVDTAKVITQAARAVTLAHELGIVHRDLKPANLFLVHNQDDEILKVLDFGLAKWKRAAGALAPGAATATNVVMGTPYYMSPEQMNGAPEADLRSDLWALGVIAFECLTGVRPFEGDNLISIGMRVCSAPVPALEPSLALPPELDAWFSRALAKDPGQRFQTARELAEELRRVCLRSVTSSSKPQAFAQAAAVAAVPAFADRGTAAGERTAPLPRASFEQQAAQSKTSAPSGADGVSEEAPSAGPMARSIGAGLKPRSRRSIAWGLVAGLFVAAIVMISALRARSLSATSDATASASPGVVAAEPTAATSLSTGNPEPPALTSPSPPPISVVPTIPEPVAVSVPDASARAATRPSSAAHPLRPNANPAVVRPNAAASPSASARRAPARRPLTPAPSSSVKALDIERTPSF